MHAYYDICLRHVMMLLSWPVVVIDLDVSAVSV